MRRPVGPCYCDGSRQYLQAPCLCTLGTGEPRKPVLIRIPRRRKDKVAATKYPTEHWRPGCRAECADVPRPCPYVGCSQNLYLEVCATGDVRIHHPHRSPGDVPPDESCALDVAERDGATLETVGLLLNLTRERARQIEVQGLQRLGRAAAHLVEPGKKAKRRKK